MHSMVRAITLSAVAAVGPMRGSVLGKRGAAAAVGKQARRR
jgi:hypothetical protein